MGTIGAVLSMDCCLFDTLGDPLRVIIIVFTGTHRSAVSVWKSSVSSWMIIFLLSPFRNGVQSCGCLIVDEISSKAARILSSEDVFGMLYTRLVGIQLYPKRVCLLYHRLLLQSADSESLLVL